MTARVWTRTANVILAFSSKIRKAETLAGRASSYQRIEDRIHEQTQRNRAVSFLNGSVRDQGQELGSRGRVHFKTIGSRSPKYLRSGLASQVAQGMAETLAALWDFLSTSELLGLKKEKAPAATSPSAESKQLV